MKKKSDPTYNSVAYKVSSENYKFVTLVRRSDRSVFYNMPQCLGPSTVIGYSSRYYYTVSGGVVSGVGR